MPGCSSAVTAATAGWADHAKEKQNQRYATINKNGRINDRDKHVVKARAGAVVLVGPVRHTIFLRLKAHGAFDERFRASDHNPVVTDWVA